MTSDHRVASSERCRVHAAASKTDAAARWLAMTATRPISRPFFVGRLILLQRLADVSARHAEQGNKRPSIRATKSWFMLFAVISPSRTMLGLA
jgi:hypothetical protein